MWKACPAIVRPIELPEILTERWWVPVGTSNQSGLRLALRR